VLESRIARLLSHRNDRGTNEEDLDPGKLVFAHLQQDRSRDQRT
jgi:hypothetical protein